MTVISFLDFSWGWWRQASIFLCLCPSSFNPRKVAYSPYSFPTHKEVRAPALQACWEGQMGSSIWSTLQGAWLIRRQSSPLPVVRKRRTVMTVVILMTWFPDPWLASCPPLDGLCLGSVILQWAVGLRDPRLLWPPCPTLSYLWILHEWMSMLSVHQQSETGIH